LKKEELVEKFADVYKKLLKEVEKVIIGQKDIIEQIFIALLSGGNCIIIGVPGLAKTLLVKAIAQALDLKFNRIQFTPDLMPSDITGTEIIQETKSGKREFIFVEGPIFTNVLLADEINRTPPKTQSALLQAMQEKIVTVNGKTYNLDLPFFVLATQNPIEQEGTYPLPEAQLDRFMLSIYIDYPDEKEEKEIAKIDTPEKLNSIKKVIPKKELLELHKFVNDVPIADYVLEYGVKLVRLTRPSNSNPLKFINQYVEWGAGPRATQHLILASKVKTLIEKRFAVARDDINFVAYNVLSHRIITNFNADAEGIKSKNVIDEIIKYLNKK